MYKWGGGGFRGERNAFWGGRGVGEGDVHEGGEGGGDYEDEMEGGPSEGRRGF